MQYFLHISVMVTEKNRHNNYMKKTIVMLACALAIGTASAQENATAKSKWNPWGEFLCGISFLDGSQGFTDYMQTHHSELDYRSVYMPSAQIGVAIGVNYQRLTLGMHLSANLNSAKANNQLVRKQDNLLYLDLGYRFDLGKGLFLEPTAGFGLGSSEIFLSSARGGFDYVNSFTTGNLIVPLTLNFWYGQKKAVGLYLQYIISVAQPGKAIITGLETEVDDLSFHPSTLTLGTMFRF